MHQTLEVDQTQFPIHERQASVYREQAQHYEAVAAAAKHEARQVLGDACTGLPDV